MAGLGFKDFAVGEVLTASDVDTYLMQQTVMRFADTGARGSALGTATGTAVPLAEGMVSYLDDTDDLQVYTGTEWRSVVPPWEDFTPTWTNFTPGNATVSARTRKVGKWREVSVQVEWGSTTSASGNIIVNLPEDRRSGDTMPVVGWASVFDFNVNVYPCVPVITTATSPNTCRLLTTDQPASSVNATSPITFTTSDVWGFYVAYEVD